MVDFQPEKSLIGKMCLALYLPLLTNGIQNLLVGLVAIGLVVPLVLGKVDRNEWYGVRFKQAYRSEKDWKEINAYGGRVMIWWSAPLVLLGLGMTVAAFLLPDAGLRDSLWVVPLSFAPLWLLGAYFQVLWWVKRRP